jgi:hypothetical protein
VASARYAVKRLLWRRYLDIYERAKANDADVVERFEHVAGAHSDGCVAALSNEVDNAGYFSVNMRPHVMAALLTGSAYQNIYHLASRYAAISGRERDEELKYLLGSYYERRVHFDRELGIPESAYYAAVNIGGAGCSTYGEFCSVITGLVVAHQNSVVLKADSLVNYIGHTLDINYQRLDRELASSSNVGKLVAIKHESDQRLQSPDDWAAMVCNDNDYTEAYVDDPLVANDLREIRILEDQHDVLMDLAFLSSSGPAKGAADRALVADFVAIKEAIAKSGIRLEILKGSKS